MITRILQHLWFALFIVFLFALLVCKCHGNERILFALAQVESGNNPHAIGRAGEITRYQILPSTLQFIKAGLRVEEMHARSFSKSNVVLARSGAKFTAQRDVDGFVLIYLGYLSSKFSSAVGRAPTHQEVYALWNLGFHGFQRRGFTLSKCPPITRSAAKRFENLCQ